MWEPEGSVAAGLRGDTHTYTHSLTPLSQGLRLAHVNRTVGLEVMENTHTPLSQGLRFCPVNWKWA